MTSLCVYVYTCVHACVWGGGIEMHGATIRYGNSFGTGHSHGLERVGD